MYSKHNETVKKNTSKAIAEEEAQSNNDIISNAELADEEQLKDVA